MKNLNKNETNDATYLLLHLDFDSSEAFVLALFRENKILRLLKAIENAKAAKLARFKPYFKLKRQQLLNQSIICQFL